jgi:anti-anti-sigma factor
VNDLAELAVREDGEVLLARLSGEIDLSNSRDLERMIEDAVPNTALGLVLDLSDLTYVDSAGIRLLLTLASRLQWRGQRLALVAPDDSRIRRVLSLAGAEVTLVVDLTVEAARERIRPPTLWA